MVPAIYTYENLDNLNFEDITYFKDHLNDLIEFFRQLDLLPTSKVCSCGRQMKLSQRKNSADGYSFRCCFKSCRQECSLRKNTFFYQSHLSLYQIFKIMYFWSVGATEQSFLMKECRINSSATIVDWKNFMRDLCLSYFLRNPSKVGGPGVKVQLDESQICKRKLGVGRILQNQSLWIVGGVDEDGRVFMVETEKRDTRTLEHIITTYVERGSIIHTDGWPAYNSLAHLGYEYAHEKVIHEREFVSSTGVHTNRIEGLWSAFKRKYRSVTNKKKEMVASYIADWMFKRLHRKRVLSKILETIKHVYIL